MGFFIHRRRKFGVVTLVMACVFAGIWIRSHYILDILTLRSEDGPRRYLTFSQHGLTWGRRWGSGQYVVLPEFMNISWESTTVDAENLFEPLNGWNIDWNWQCCGFQFGESYLGSILEFPSSGAKLKLAGIAIWNIPHWSLVAPLTLLSAWLLLSKPRFSNQKKIN